MFVCPCCRFNTLPEEPPGTLEICPVCYWVDDKEQYQKPSKKNGVNRVSLDEARKFFHEIGASSEEDLEHVRPPTLEEIPLSQEIKKVHNQISSSIAVHAKSLAPVQPFQVGWPKDAAIKLLKSFSESNVCVVCIEAYILDNDLFVPTYSNFTCATLRRKFESNQITALDYASKSQSEAIGWIDTYSNLKQNTILYAICLKEL